MGPRPRGRTHCDRWGGGAEKKRLLEALCVTSWPQGQASSSTSCPWPGPDSPPTHVDLCLVSLSLLAHKSLLSPFGNRAICNGGWGCLCEKGPFLTSRVTPSLEQPLHEI